MKNSLKPVNNLSITLLKDIKNLLISCQKDIGNIKKRLNKLENKEKIDA